MEARCRYEYEYEITKKHEDNRDDLQEKTYKRTRTRRNRGAPLKSDMPPPFKGMFRLSQYELHELKQQLDQLLRDGNIKPSTSPYGAPILFAKKKNDKLRMCIDYRALNSQTIQNRYALPQIDKLFDRLHGAKVFSKLDFTNDYYQIAIKPKDHYKTPLQNTIQNTLRSLWIQCNAIWTDKRACHIPNLDEQYFQRYVRCLRHCLPRRHPCLFEK
jgi:hypothetical protein